MNKKTGNLSFELHDAHAADVALAKIYKLMQVETEEEARKKKAVNKPPGMTVNIAGKEVVNTMAEDEEGVLVEEEMYKDETPYGDPSNPHGFNIVEENAS